jgi:hypothetical protein
MAAIDTIIERDSLVHTFVVATRSSVWFRSPELPGRRAFHVSKARAT